MTNNQKQDAALSCALTAVFFAVIIGIWGVWYRTNDDAILSNIAFGAYGTDRVHLVYVNLLYGWLLRGLQCLNDSLNWFALYVAILGVLILVLQLIGYPGTVPFAIPDMSGAVTSTLRFWNV